MGSIIVCGGSMIGMCTALMLAQDKHQVTVLEADPDAPPDTPVEAWQRWRRRGVGQFHQPHNLFARFRKVCDEELPGLTGRLLTAGCVWVDYVAAMPPTITDRRSQPGDERLRFVTGRRPVVEAAIARVAEEQPGLTVRRGARIDALVPGRQALASVPHITGVHLTTGETIRADLVIDATGRRTRSASWLVAAGAQPPYSEARDRGYAYYTRFYTGTPPELLGRAVTPLGSISVLTLPADNNTWSVTIFGLSDDRSIKMLRRPDAFERVVAACPLQAHWLDGKPITGVLPMAGVLDTYHRHIIDGAPVVTGFATVGDAWACTNPSAGRGLSMGIVQAQMLRRAVASHAHNPVQLARAYDAATEQLVTPLYRDQVAADTARVAEMDAARQGAPPPPPPPSSWVTGRLPAAAATEPDAFRGLIEIVTCMELPSKVLARPAVQSAIARAASGSPPTPPGPDREQLLGLLAA